MADDGDVVAVMCHAERAEIVDWLHAQGATSDDPDAIRRKVVRARGEHECEDEIAALWELPDAAARVDAAAARCTPTTPATPGSPTSYAGTHDSAGDEAAAVPLYEEALAAGLREPHRHRAQLQLASSLRNVGRLDEAVAVIDDVAARHPDSLGVAAFRALVHHDAGGLDARAVASCSPPSPSTSTDPDVVRYRRALTAYAAQLRD